MWGGAVSTGQVVREFSSCSLEEINAALEGFPNSCLHDSTMAAGPTTPTKTSSSTAATSAPSSPSTSSRSPAPSSPRCKATLIQKQLVSARQHDGSRP